MKDCNDGCQYNRRSSAVGRRSLLNEIVDIVSLESSGFDSVLVDGKLHWKAITMARMLRAFRLNASDLS